jgi:deoxyguanosine kinase
MQRIALRDRSYERNMQTDYIDELNHAYDDFFLKGPRNSPVLTIEVGTYDFLHTPADLQWIEARIREELQITPHQPELPLAEQRPTGSRSEGG